MAIRTKEKKTTRLTHQKAEPVQVILFEVFADQTTSLRAIWPSFVFVEDDIYQLAKFLLDINVEPARHDWYELARSNVLRVAADSDLHSIDRRLITALQSVVYIPDSWTVAPTTATTGPKNIPLNNTDIHPQLNCTNLFHLAADLDLAYFLVLLLLRRPGCDLALLCCNRHGQTPRQLAQTAGNHRILTLLDRYGRGEGETALYNELVELSQPSSASNPLTALPGYRCKKVQSGRVLLASGHVYDSSENEQRCRLRHPIVQMTSRVLPADRRVEMGTTGLEQDVSMFHDYMSKTYADDLLLPALLDRPLTAGSQPAPLTTAACGTPSDWVERLSARLTATMLQDDYRNSWPSSPKRPAHGRRIRSSSMTTSGPTAGQPIAEAMERSHSFNEYQQLPDANGAKGHDNPAFTLGGGELKEDNDVFDDLQTSSSDQPPTLSSSEPVAPPSSSSSSPAPPPLPPRTTTATTKEAKPTGWLQQNLRLDDEESTSTAKETNAAASTGGDAPAGDTSMLFNSSSSTANRVHYITIDPARLRRLKQHQNSSSSSSAGNTHSSGGGVLKSLFSSGRFEHKRKDREPARPTHHFSACQPNATDGTKCPVCDRLLATDRSACVECAGCRLSVHSDCAERLPPARRLCSGDMQVNGFKANGANQLSEALLNLGKQPVAPIQQSHLDDGERRSSYVSGQSDNASMGSASIHSWSADRLPTSSTDTVDAPVKFETGSVAGSASSVTLPTNVSLPVSGLLQSILDPGPEAWSICVPAELRQELVKNEVDRQNRIWELIRSEQIHLKNLLVIDHVYYQGLRTQMHYNEQQLDQLFPSLHQLIDVHKRFWQALKARQLESEQRRVGQIGDVLVAHLSGENGQQLIDSYGDFCGRMQEARQRLEQMQQNDPKLNQFLTRCRLDVLCQKMDLQGMLTIVYQTVTQYELHFEKIERKTNTDDKTELANLAKARQLVGKLNQHINDLVGQRENQLFWEDLLGKLDAKCQLSVAVDRSSGPTTLAGGDTVKPMVVTLQRKELREKRLLFHAPVLYCSARGKKTFEVLLCVLNDMVILFKEMSTQKVEPFKLDDKRAAHQLNKLIIRPRADDQRGLYLMVSDREHSEMYELLCRTPRDCERLSQHLHMAIQGAKLGPVSGTPSSYRRHSSLDFSSIAESRFRLEPPSSVDGDYLVVHNDDLLKRNVDDVHSATVTRLGSFVGGLPLQQLFCQADGQPVPADDGRIKTGLERVDVASTFEAVDSQHASPRPAQYVDHLRDVLVQLEVAQRQLFCLAMRLSTPSTAGCSTNKSETISSMAEQLTTFLPPVPWTDGLPVHLCDGVVDEPPTTCSSAGLSTDNQSVKPHEFEDTNGSAARNTALLPKRVETFSGAGTTSSSSSLTTGLSATTPTANASAQMRRSNTITTRAVDSESMATVLAGKSLGRPRPKLSTITSESTSLVEVDGERQTIDFFEMIRVLVEASALLMTEHDQVEGLSNSLAKLATRHQRTRTASSNSPTDALKVGAAEARAQALEELRRLQNQLQVQKVAQHNEHQANVAWIEREQKAVEHQQKTVAEEQEQLRVQKAKLKEQKEVLQQQIDNHNDHWRKKEAEFRAREERILRMEAAMASKDAANISSSSVTGLPNGTSSSSSSSASQAATTIRRANTILSVDKTALPSTSSNAARPEANAATMVQSNSSSELSKQPQQLLPSKLMSSKPAKRLKASTSVAGLPVPTASPVRPALEQRQIIPENLSEAKRQKSKERKAKPKGIAAFV